MAHRHVLAVALGVVLALTGCSDDAPSDADTSDTGTTVPSPTDGAADATGATSTPGSTSHAPTGGVDVEAQVRHPNGTVLTVTSMTFEDPVVDVDMEVLNGHAQEIYLHIQNWDDQVRLVDDLGNSYRFVAPESETEDALVVAPAESVGGTFRFLGPVVPEASSLSLVWNVTDDEIDGFGINDEADLADAPGFVVADLPVSP